jgi:DNA-binding response OmpR family regulator
MLAVTSSAMRVPVLVADDESLSRMAVAAMIRKGGYDVQLATDGQQAWAALQQPDAPPLAIVDWMMPGLDGIEICRRLRRVETATPTYVILLTSRDAAADVVEGLRAGADDYVTKPPNEDELLARISVGALVHEASWSNSITSRPSAPSSAKRRA